MKLLLVLASISFVAFIECSRNVKFSPFVKIGSQCVTKDGLGVKKSYYVPKNIRLSWAQSLMYCKAFDMELASFESIEEINEVRDFKSSVLPEHINVAAMADGAGQPWYWVHDEQAIKFNIPWRTGEPSGVAANERCLHLYFTTPIGFNDLECYKDYQSVSFLCQKIEAFSDECQ